MKKQIGRETLKKYEARARLQAVILRSLVILAAVLTASVFLVLVTFVLVRGLPNLKPELFSPHYTSQNVSMLPALVNTLTMTALSLLFAVPAGIGAAVYLTEYARRGSRLVKAVRLTAETLAGIPSIVYGLFGYLLFVITLGLGFSMLGGALTLSLMILPLIMRTTEEALKSVPDAYREGSFGLGAGRLRTIFRVVLPSAVPGMLAGVILGIGRITGETAALIYTSGTVAQAPESLLDSGRTLSVHMYALMSEGLYTEQAYATAAVLLILVAGINALSASVAKTVTPTGLRHKKPPKHR